MKNNLLNLKPTKSFDVDVCLPTGNDFHDIIAASKFENDVFAETLEELRGICEEEFFEDLNSDEESQWMDESCQETNLNGFLYAGYVDCMDEAIRFLVEEEKISPEHPIVQNLRDHLENCKEKIFGAFPCSDDQQEPEFLSATGNGNFRFSDTYGRIQNCRDFG